jgi:hypothetical protein
MTALYRATTRPPVLAGSYTTPLDATQRARHLLAGTAIDILNGLRACDPKRLAIYFTKHSSPNKLGDKEYQHIVPEAWRQSGHGPGRFWGSMGCNEQRLSWRSPSVHI